MSLKLEERIKESRGVIPDVVDRRDVIGQLPVGAKPAAKASRKNSVDPAKTSEGAALPTAALSVTGAATVGAPPASPKTIKMVRQMILAQLLLLQAPRNV